MPKADGAGSRVMVLTGAGSGIGRHLAGRLLRDGHRLLATDLDEARLLAAARDDGWPEERRLLRAQDVRDDAAWPGVIDTVVRTWGSLDVMLNVAGTLRPSSAHSHTPVEEVTRVIVEDVLENRPLEVLIPRSRGALARLTSLWPGLALRLAPSMMRRGALRQKALLRSRS